jgi:peroxiredoxin
LKKKLLGGLALVGAAAVVLIFASPSYRQGEPSIAGSKAPDFSFAQNGSPARLADLRGRVVVLNFWATWCPPCVAEVASLNRLHQQIAPQGGMVLGISVDEDASAYEKFLQAQQVRFPTYRDPSKKISSRYGTFMYPETYIIGRDGRIARKVIGPQTWDSPDWVAYLETLLRK